MRRKPEPRFLPTKGIFNLERLNGVLLFTKAQHSLKLIAYLKLNESVSREKIISFTYQTAATHACPMCHCTFRAQIGLIGHQWVNNKWWVAVIAPTNGQPRKSCETYHAHFMRCRASMDGLKKVGEEVESQSPRRRQTPVSRMRCALVECLQYLWQVNAFRPGVPHCPWGFCTLTVWVHLNAPAIK